MRVVLRRALVVVLSLTLVASAGVVGALVVADHTNEPYSELALLGPNGTAGNYPEEVTVGETARLTAVVTNNRVEEQAFTLVTTYDGRRTVRNVTVGARGYWRGTLSVTPGTTGSRALTVSLYQGPPSGEPHSEVRLWVTGVREPREPLSERGGRNHRRL